MIESHYGKVTNIDDPDKRGRIRVEAPTLIGSNKELPFWVEPILVFMGSGKGFLAIPDKDSIVELTVTTRTSSDESAQQSSLDSPNIRYKPVAISTVDSIPDALSTNYPHRRGMSVDAGYWYFDDTKSDKTFHLEHTSGAKIHIDKNGNVFVTPASGQKVHIDDETQTAQSVARVGDKTTAHTHTITFALTAPSGGGPVTGTITAATSEPTIAEGSSTIKGGG